MKSSLRFLFIIFVFGAIPFSVFSQERATIDEELVSTSNTSPIQVSIEEMAYDGTKRQLQLNTVIKNTSGTYIDSVSYRAELYKGDNLSVSGDVFGNLEYVYQDTGPLDILAFGEERDEDIEIIIPATIPSGNYFIKLFVYNNTFTYYGLGYSTEEITLSGEDNIYQFEDVFLSGQDGVRSLTSVIERGEPYLLNIKFPQDYAYRNEDTVSMKIYKNNFDNIFIKEIRGILGDAGVYNKENNSLQINLYDEYFNTAGLYNVEIGIIGDGEKVVFNNLSLPLVYSGDYTYLYDVNIPNLQYEIGKTLPISVNLVSNTYEKVLLKAEIVDLKGDKFSFEKEVTPEVGQIEEFVFDQILEEDGTMKELTISIFDIETKETIDTHVFVFPKSDIGDNPLFSENGLKTFVKYGMIALLIIIVIISIFYLIRHNRNTLASLVIILSTGIFSIAFSFDFSVYAYETKIDLSIGEIVTDGNSNICPYEKALYIVGSSRCPLDGSAISGTVRLQTKDSLRGEWNSKEEYKYNSNKNRGNLFGPYIYNVSLDGESNSLAIRPEFTRSLNEGSLCVDEVKTYGETSELLCDVDICSNVDGIQFDLPRPDNVYTSYGVEEKVTSLGMVSVGSQCLSRCSEDVSCGERAECVFDNEIQESYCRPILLNICEKSPSPDFKEIRDTFKIGERVFFKIVTTGGSKEYVYDWSSIEDTVADNIAFKNFNTNGDFSVGAKVSSGDLESNVVCPVNIRECTNNTDCTLGKQCSLNGFCVNSLLQASCDTYSDVELRNKTYTTKSGDTVYWGASVSGGEEPYTFSWAGDIGGSSKVESGQYTNPGNKKASVTISDSSPAKQNVTVQCSTVISECALGDNSTCSGGDVCRKDLFCGAPFPIIDEFKIKGARLVSDGGTCSVSIGAHYVNKCAIVNVSNGDRISLSSNNGTLNEIFEVTSGRYYLECENIEGDTVESEKISCSTVPQTTSF